MFSGALQVRRMSATVKEPSRSASWVDKSAPRTLSSPNCTASNSCRFVRRATLTPVCGEREAMTLTTIGSDSDAKVKLWANSGDSHILEPDDLWYRILPKQLADRMPRTEKISDSEEVVHVDGQSFTRTLPRSANKILKGTLRGEDVEGTLNEFAHRPPGSRDVKARLA